MGSGETPGSTCIQANTDQGEVLNRQDSVARANLIRDLLRKELCRGLGRRSRRSEREGSVSSSSSQEGSHLSQSRSFRCRSRAPSRSCGSWSPSRRSNIVVFRPAPPTCQEVALAPPDVSSFLGGLPDARLTQGHPSATVNQASPSPPPMFILPLALLPPPYASRSISASPASPRPLISFCLSMTPSSRYELTTPVPSVMGPPPAPLPSS